MLANKMSSASIFCRHVIIMDLLIRLTGLLEFHNVCIRNRRLEMSTVLEGLEGYFQDSGFDQNTVRESGKR